MILKLEGTVEVPAQTMLTVYLGLGVLRSLLKRGNLQGGIEATDKAMAELAEAMPELPGLTALR